MLLKDYQSRKKSLTITFFVISLIFNLFYMGLILWKVASNDLTIHLVGATPYFLIIMGFATGLYFKKRSFKLGKDSITFEGVDGSNT